MDAKVKMSKKVEIKEPECELFLPGEMGAVLELMVRRKDGSIRESRVMKSRSYVRQFLELLLLQMGMVPELAPMEIRDTGNTLRELAQSNLTFACNALTNEDVWGLVAGTGTTPPAIDDYSLETRIAHGVGAGQLQYGNVAFGLPTASGAVSHFTVTRDFSNASGATVTVNEIGLVVGAVEAKLPIYHYRNDATYYLVIRDVVSGGIDVANGETLTVNYRQQATA